MFNENMNQACNACGYCRIACPVKINIPAYMQYYNRQASSGVSNTEIRKDIRSQHKHGILSDCYITASACIYCRRCETACPQRLPIVKRLAEIAELEKCDATGNSI